MKKIVLLLSIITLLANVSFAQEDKTVTLTVSGQGKTQNEAKQNALRNAIEQAFGTFISSNTEILNDDLVKDEIVSISNGNIHKFEILSEVQIENGEWSTTLKATVSVTKLTSFCESKGISVEFKGSLFAFNVNQQILNEKNEIKAIENVCQVIRKIADVSFDYSITASDPVSLDASNSKWRIPIYVSVYKNSNFEKIPNILYSTLKGLSLSLEEAENYKKLGKNVYPISIASNENDYGYILLRTDSSISHLSEVLYYFSHSLQNFKISNGITEWSFKDKPENPYTIDDDGFQIFINGKWKDHYDKVYSVFFRIGFRNSNFIDLSSLPYWEPVSTGEISKYIWKKQFSFVNNLKNEILTNPYCYIISFLPAYDNTNLQEVLNRIHISNQRFMREKLGNYPDTYMPEISKIIEELVKSIPVEEGGLELKIRDRKKNYSSLQLKQLFRSIILRSLDYRTGYISQEYPKWWREWVESNHINISKKNWEELMIRFDKFKSILDNKYEKLKVQLSKELEEKGIVRFYFNDIRTLEEINKISGYRVLPIKQ